MLFERLVTESAASLEGFAILPFVTAVRARTVTRERYKRFLNDLYHVVWHFCPTMAAGASRCDDEYSAIRYALYEHIFEEKGHELWVLEDCVAVGGQPFADQVSQGLPAIEVQAMNAFNYHVVERQHGAAALGMVFMLEIISQRLAGGLSNDLAKALNLKDDEGVKFLSFHGPMDAVHLAAISLALNTITDQKVGDIISNAVAVNFKLFSATMA